MKFEQKSGKNFWAPLMPLAFFSVSLHAVTAKAPQPTGASSGASSGSGWTEKDPTTGRLLDTAVEGVSFCGIVRGDGNHGQAGHLQVQPRRYG